MSSYFSICLDDDVIIIFKLWIKFLIIDIKVRISDWLFWLDNIRIELWIILIVRGEIIFYL